VIGLKFEECTGVSQSRLELLTLLYQVDEISQSDLQKGMVSRRRKPEDNRITLVKLSNQGRERIESYKKEKERFMEEMLVNISTEERNVLLHLLSQMKKNIENIKA
jgi:DNA-binding MarR family transcriptional regulator